MRRLLLNAPKLEEVQEGDFSTFARWSTGRPCLEDSKPKGANKQAPIITYKDNNGELRHVRVEVVSVI